MSDEQGPGSDNSGWRWIPLAVILAVHDRLLAEHGGAEGVRDIASLETALARPVNLAACGQPDAADLAAAYAFGIARTHGFVDGNKRTAWVAARLFLANHGLRLDFDPKDALRTMVAVAAGTLSETALSDWLRQRLTELTASD